MFTRRPPVALVAVLALAGVFVLSGAVCEAVDTPSDEQAPTVGDGPYPLEVAFPGLSFRRPVDLQAPPDGSGRLFVLEQPGRVRAFPNDPATEDAAVVLDIEDLVRDQGNEEGLLGLAFHPDFAANGLFYLYHSASNPRRSVVARYQIDPADPNRALPESRAVILEVEQPYGNHNGGQIAFGLPEGPASERYLYVSLGDGGSGGDPQENGEDPTTLLGSILRIDVDSPSGGRAYGIPADNPFADGTGGRRPEIYAYGLRNVWRFSFDEETGRMWGADVGQNAYEEIDIIEKGGNYGWDVMEATHCFEPQSGCDQSGLILPVWEYPHSEGRSITGGFVYRGTRVPALVGRYVYADYVSGRVWALDYDGETAQNEDLVDTDLQIASFGLDADRELYLLAFDGRIYRFADPES